MTKPAPDESLSTPRDNSSRLLSFIVDEAPEPGSATEVADGVYWLRFPLPMTALNHINLWAIKNHDGWVVILNSPEVDMIKRCHGQWKA